MGFTSKVRKITTCLKGIKININIRKYIGLFFGMLKTVARFYYEGFRNMTWGRKLWGIILVKLFVIFAVLRLFFFPDILKRDYRNDQERSDHVLEQLINP